MFLIVIQSSIEITSKPPAINQEYFSNLGGSIFDGKSGSILGGNLQINPAVIESLLDTQMYAPAQ
jgi:hypothetical protein